jgi:hypothetical protein
MKKRKAEMISYNNENFADIAKKLPKFANEEGDNRKWWTKQMGYCASTLETAKSAKEMLLKKKSCGAKQVLEALVIADHSVDPPPADPFKSVHVAKPPKPTGQDPCTAKVNHIKYEIPKNEVEY